MNLLKTNHRFPRLFKLPNRNVAASEWRRVIKKNRQAVTYWIYTFFSNDIKEMPSFGQAYDIKAVYASPEDIETMRERLYWKDFEMFAPLCDASLKHCEFFIDLDRLYKVMPVADVDSPDVVFDELFESDFREGDFDGI